MNPAIERQRNRRSVSMLGRIIHDEISRVVYSRNTGTETVGPERRRMNPTGFASGSLIPQD